MTLGFIFWLLMLLALVFGGVTYKAQLGTPLVWGGTLISWILLFLLGWQTFGWPIKG